MDDHNTFGKVNTPSGVPGASEALKPAPAADVKPIEDHLTLHPDGDENPSPQTEDGRPQAFVVGDQTAAGALTPEEGQHPGEPATGPGQTANVLDPYNVNGTAANAEAIARGDGIAHPDLHKEREATKDHPRG